MKYIYYIDVPDWTSKEGNWKEVKIVNTRAEAIEFLWKHFGVAKKFSSCFITRGQK